MHRSTKGSLSGDRGMIALAFCGVSICFALASFAQNQSASSGNTGEMKPFAHVTKPAGPLQLKAITAETLIDVSKLRTPPTRTTFMATWNKVPGASGYLLDVSTDESFNTYLSGYQSLDVGNVPARLVTGLTKSTTYYYRVRAYGASVATSATPDVMTTTTNSTAGLTINPTFDPSLPNSDPDYLGFSAAVQRAINTEETLFSDPITINIFFRHTTTADPCGSLPSGFLGRSCTSLYSTPWSTFVSYLQADAKTNNDTRANATLPSTPLSTSILNSSANGRAVGLSTLGNVSISGGIYDATITLNSTANFAFTRPPGTFQYDAERTIEHEIDEVMGLGSYLGCTSCGTNLRPQDLFSWKSSGVRGLSSTDSRYFSTDGGNNDWAIFNSDPSGDFGDWYSPPCPQTGSAFVQNAFGCTGDYEDVGESSPEGINLDVIGYDLVIPNVTQNVTTDGPTFDSTNPTTATLNAHFASSLNPDELEFLWGTTPALGNLAAGTSITTTSGGNTNFKGAILGVRPNTTYFYQAVVHDANGWEGGTIRSFNPPPTSLPPVGNWVSLNSPISSPILMLLLTDGNVMVNDSRTATWYRLTPDHTGSYQNGTWSQLSSMHDARLFFASQVLPDGRVFVAGGEFGQTDSAVGTAEVFDPITNNGQGSWAYINPPANLLDPSKGESFSDAESQLLVNGDILVVGGAQGFQGTLVYDPAQNLWSAGGTPVGSQTQDETCWVMLPDSSILTVDLGSQGNSTERYIPSTNTWVADTNLPFTLNNGGEMGAAFLLPTGEAFYMGGTPNDALYTPSGNTSPGSWRTGPQKPNKLISQDVPGTMMPNGQILNAFKGYGGTDAAGDLLSAGYTVYCLYDPVTNLFDMIDGPNGTSFIQHDPFTTAFLNLPDGTILHSGLGNSVAGSGPTKLWIYQPAGPQLAAGKPSVSVVVQNQDGSFTARGTQFNGISQGAAYGDDWQMATNYPIVRLSDGQGNVYYARSYNWSIGVMTGSKPVTTNFSTSALPSSFTPTMLQVVANGIASDAISFIPSLVTVVPPYENNDGFAFAKTLSGVTGEDFDNNITATLQSGEPQIDGNAGGASVWFQWTAPQTGTVVFDDSLDSFQSIFAAYKAPTGSPATLNNLIQVANDLDNSNQQTHQLIFQATQGEIYYIQLDGLNGAAGAIHLKWTQQAPVYNGPSTLSTSVGQSVYFIPTFSNIAEPPFSATNLPPGLTATSLNSGIIISGQGTTPGIYKVGLTAVNPIGTGQNAVTFVVVRNPAPSAGLGSNPNGNGLVYSEGYGVSDGGTIAVGESTNGDNHTAITWTANGGIIDLGHSGNSQCGSCPSKANAVSADGSIIVGFGDNGSGVNIAGYWPGTGTANDFVTLLGLSPGRSEASAVSQNGTFVAGLSTYDAFGHVQATRWQGGQGGTTLGLGFLPGGSISTGLGISGDGSIVVGQSTSTNSPSSGEAFKWTQFGGMQALGGLTNVSSALGVSADGTTIVGFSTGDGISQPRWDQPIYWQTGSQPQVISRFNGDTQRIGGYARAVSSDGGVIVGTRFDPTNSVGPLAFVWDKAHQTRILSDVLASEYGINFTGWNLSDAYAVSRDATAIVGYGSGNATNENTEAFISSINYRSQTYTDSQTPTGFHTSHLGGYGTSVDVIDAPITSMGPETLSVATASSTDPNLASDIADMTGVDGKVLVLQLSYDPTAATTLGGGNTLVLGSFDGTTWENTVASNSSPLQPPQQIIGPYDGNLVLGHYGVDTTNHVVWAVVNHCGRFGVISPAAALTYNITASASPTGGGTVSGGGSYGRGSTVTVTAGQNSCYTFSNWTENGTVVSSSATYSFIATADRTLVANFTQIFYTITANAGTGGSVSGGGAYSCASTVTLTATPNMGYQFSNWTENGSVVPNAGQTYQFTASSNHTLVANFVSAPTYTVSVSASPSAAGSASGGGPYTSGSIATVIARPNTCYGFTNWTENGSVVSTSPTYQFTASANRTLVANFSQLSYTVTVNADTGGNVTGGGSYTCGSSATLTATPNGGYQFTGWSGDTDGAQVAGNSLTVTVDSNKSFIAHFATQSGFDPNGPTFPQGPLIKAADGNFYGATQGDGNGIVFKMGPDGTVTVLHQFDGTDGTDPDGPLLAVVGVANSITLYGETLGGGQYNAGTIFKIAADGTGFTTLVTFTGGADGAAPQGGLTRGPSIFGQQYDQYLYGTTQNGGNFRRGTVFRVNFSGGATTPETLHHFTGQQDGATPLGGLVLSTHDTGGELTSGNFFGVTFNGGNGFEGTLFKMTPDGALEPLFNFDGSDQFGGKPYGGLLESSDGLLYGTTTDADSGNGTIFRFTPSGLQTLYTFSDDGHDGDFSWRRLIQTQTNPIVIYGITKKGGSQSVGTIFHFTGYDLGTPPPFIITTDYNFNWSSGQYPEGLVQGSDGTLYGTASEGGAYGEGTAFHFTEATASLQVIHNFGQKSYTLSVTAINGSVTRSPDQATYMPGTQVVLTPSNTTSGYVFDHWSGDASGNANPLTIIMDSNKSITGNFIQQVATPVISPSGGGTYKKKVTPPVTISCATPGATIYYTIDGPDPTTSSSTYPISSGKKKFKGLTVSGAKGSSHTVKAMATAPGYANSAIATATYNF